MKEKHNEIITHKLAHYHDSLDKFVLESIDILTDAFVFFVGLLFLFIVITYFIDRFQYKDTIRRNYPVVGRLRYFFSSLGEFFRQYFFAMDREEMPFNRAERDWVHNSSKGVKNTVAFGSTKNISDIGTPLFVNCAFAKLDTEVKETSPVIIGEGYCKNPYTAKSIINISAMSFGALSAPAVLAFSMGASMAGCWHNTGEGGISPYHLEGGADLIFQLGTAKYGAGNPDHTLNEELFKEDVLHEQVKMIEIKLSQGAKPGKGGMLSASKVTKEIAKIRKIKAGEPSISPNRHVEIYDVNSMLDFIAKVKKMAEKPVGIKFVIGEHGWLDNFFKEINKRGLESAPDFITLDSCDGGTGEAPMPLIDNVGLPIKETLPLLVNKLKEYKLKDRIKVIASGKLITPAEVAWALCVGADFINSARGFMFAIGCIQALKCNQNTCPTGITTHKKKLQAGLDPDDKSVRVANYIRKIHYGVGLIAHSCGVEEPRLLRKHHVRIVQANGKSIPLDEIYPDP